MELDNVLVAGITPYFLEKGNFWFKENMQKILQARQTQAFFEDNLLYLEKNQKYNLSESLRKLDEMGYEKVLQVQEPGEFSHKGGVVEIFPINLNNAVRLDFLGNTIESIEKLDTKIENEDLIKNILKKRLKSQKLFSDLKNLKEGDYLVHLDHGVGQFVGLSSIANTQYYTLNYAADDKLYIPLGLERKLSRYVGFADPKISRLSSVAWQETKRKAKEEIEKFAKELLEIYAKREVAQRPPYVQDEEIDKILASTFIHEETPDQIQAIEDIKNDLQKTEPMDRVICGDVGFGKTEVALRAMAMAIKSGYQSALLCPTTILAHQHFQNFKKRLKNLPINIALLSRLQSTKDQTEIINYLKSGKIDMLVGTHRILSKDINFKNLGMMIIDDEQKFGVKQKEKFKQMRSSLDVLSLSATPIPRTLYMSLSSLKNISLIQTPPKGRLSVETFVMTWSEKIIKKAIEQEIARSGQVYYLHNRVETILGVKKFLEKLVPTAAFGVGHGQLREKELIRAMDDFQKKKFDVLIATTIIENGIDLPDVNTLIAADASKLGLSQAHQIRGRIGRREKQAFAYFLSPKKPGDLAIKRLKALKETTELGAGYQIALKDLEIRGAGNILGKEQSGNINRIGLNLYCQMLSEAIEKMRQS